LSILISTFLSQFEEYHFTSLIASFKVQAIYALPQDNFNYFPFTLKAY